ncbi:hypothetical protein [Desulfomicrobium escambiense]|uniref:hypothetical protein n=1 Tax=Desulfomicrobium escambiense TaxID=29503 RepID=UPI0004261424|nr:hypothetical protein [Desulfomicrobium escambiense]
MASKPSLFIRVLQAIIHRVWTVLFFLTAFSLATLVNHWWDAIANVGRLAMSAIELLRQ